VIYQAEVIAERPKAICCHLNGDSVQHWIARSQIQPGSQVQRPGDRGWLIVSDWLVENAHLPISHPDRIKGETSMAFENRPNSGVLFQNKNKGNNEKAPNLKGNALLELEDGSTVELDLAAWTKQSDKAGKWLSLSVKLKQEHHDRDSAQPQSGGGRAHFNQRVAQMGTPVDSDLDAALGKRDEEDALF
jgi:hypothetical protein